MSDVCLYLNGQACIVVSCRSEISFVRGHVKLEKVGLLMTAWSVRMIQCGVSIYCELIIAINGIYRACTRVAIAFVVVISGCGDFFLCFLFYYIWTTNRYQNITVNRNFFRGMKITHLLRFFNACWFACIHASPQYSKKPQAT